MERHNHYSHLGDPHPKYWLHDKYSDLVLADIFRDIAISMISLFVPLFLLLKGFPLILIVGFELGMLFISALIHVFVLKKISSWGVKRALVVSYVLNIILYIILYNTDSLLSAVRPPLYLFIIGILNISALSIYWTAHHVYFFSTTKIKDTGKKTGLLLGLPTAIGVIGPFLGASIIDSLGWHTAFLFSALILTLAGGTLLLSGNIKVKPVKLSIKNIIDNQHQIKNLIYFIQGFNLVTTGFIWPIFMFVMNIKIITIGLLYFFARLAHAVVCYFSGKQMDIRGNRLMVQYSALSHGLTIIFRAFTTTAVAMGSWLILGGLSAGMMQVTLEAGFYKSAHQDTANSILNRELYLHLGRIALFIALIIVLYVSTIKIALITTLVLGGIITMLLSVVASFDKTIIK